LLLSSSVDSTIKIWDVNEHRNCIRTYHGHTESVIGIKFNDDGKQFASWSFDKNVKIWDTETGKVLQTFTYPEHTPYCVAFHPNGKTFLVGGTDKLVTEYDIKSKEELLQYDRHQGTVNSIVFIPESEKFITTSDDKGFRVWESSVPVTQKWHTDPTMNSMPSCALHPGGKYVACQSLDNSIQIFEAFGKYKHRKKKALKGHMCAGYGIQVNFSNDGKFVISGDSEGKVYIWDFKSTKLLKTIQAHDSVLGSLQWHPLEKSKIVTSGWDGLIKYWD